MTVLVQRCRTGGRKTLSRDALRGCRRRGFTLVEMLLAVLIFVVIMALLLRAFTDLEETWTTTDRLSEIYNNANVVFDVFTRDLQAATATGGDPEDAGDNICFHQPGSQSLSFVTVGNPLDEEATSDSVEVVYRLNGHALERAAINSAETEAGYDIYGPRPEPSADRLNGQYDTVIENVNAMTFQCYDYSGSSNSYDSVPDQSTDLPEAIKVQLTLLDDRSMERWEKMNQDAPEAAERVLRKNLRTFTKTIYVSKD